MVSMQNWGRRALEHRQEDLDSLNELRKRKLIWSSDEGYPDSVREKVEEVCEYIRCLTDDATRGESDEEYYNRMKRLKMSELDKSVADGIIESYKITGEYKNRGTLSMDITVIPVIPIDYVKVSVSLGGETVEETKETKRIHFL